MKFFSHLKGKLGPGVITGASDDDPSGILTYLQAGVVLGISSLWTALITLPLMYTIQEMCGRIGFVTNKGLISLIKEHYSRIVLYLIVLISAIVIITNVGADLLAIAVIGEKLTAITRFFWLPVTAGSILAVTIFFSYPKFAKILKWLTLSLFFYIITVLYIKVDWGQAILSTIWPAHFQWNVQSVMLLTAIIGTTISPYLFFWQAEEEIEDRGQIVSKKRLKKFIVTKHELKNLKEDTFLGMLFSNAVMWFLIMAAAQLSRLYGLESINNFDQAALSLRPLLGDSAFIMFSLGIVGTGLLAIPVLAGSVGYIISEAFGWKKSINLPFRQAKPFYFVIILTTFFGMLLSLIGLDPIQLLIYTAVLYTVITPIIIFLILHIGNSKKIMGSRRNSLTSNILGYSALILISVLVVFYLINLFK